MAELNTGMRDNPHQPKRPVHPQHPMSKDTQRWLLRMLLQKAKEGSIEAAESLARLSLEAEARAKRPT